RRVALLLAGASVLVSLSVSFAWRGAAASAAAGGGPTYMSTEAWYLEPPPCVSLIDCSPASAASPYPKDTLHVSDTAGQETAQPNATWHVVFYAGKEPSKDAPPITATLDYSTYSYSAAPPPPPATGGTGSAGGGSGGQFATSGNVGGGFTSSFPSQPSVSTTT